MGLAWTWLVGCKAGPKISGWPYNCDALQWAQNMVRLVQKEQRNAEQLHWIGHSSNAPLLCRKHPRLICCKAMLLLLVFAKDLATLSIHTPLTACTLAASSTACAGMPSGTRRGSQSRCS